MKKIETRLEQTGAIQLLLYLYDKKKVKLSDVIIDQRGKISQAALYPAAKVLSDLGLITDVKTDRPPRRFLSITPKGEHAVKKLEEFREILEKE
nr:helix-turn-helix transcriptional regulator [Candidatus Freyarchaeota archaeon]